MTISANVIGYLGKATKFGREIVGRANSNIQDILHFTGSGANDTQQGSDIEASEILCMGHPSNTKTVWVRANTTATVNDSWPLAAGETFQFFVDNLSELEMLIVVDGEKLIVAYA